MKITLPFSKKTIILLFLLLSSLANYSQTVINSETFESNFGIWTSGGGNVTRSNTAGTAYQGSNSVRFNGTTGLTLTSPVTGINTLLYNKIDVKFFLRSNVNDGERITLQYRSSTLASWQDVKVITDGSGAPGSPTGRDINTTGVYHAFYATLFSTDYTFSTLSQFRFEAVIANNSRFFYLDNVSIIGTAYNTITNGPGGITANLETWLRADKVNGTGTIADNSTVNTWQDVGKGNDANVIDETNAALTNKPVYKDNSTSNLNFNPVVFFNNNTSSTVSDLSGLTNRAEMNGTGGFFTNEQFIVILNDTPSITNSSSFPSDIYCSQKETGAPYSTDVTGFGLGGYTQRIDNEVISYCIGDSPSPNPSDVTLRGYGTAQTSTTTSYTNLTAILNARNLITVPTTNGMELYKDGLRIDNTEVGVPKFENSSNNRYWLGRSQSYNGSFGGRIAEVISYSARKNNTTERRKIESYLAIKYGITLGINGTSLDYQDNNGNIIWNIAANTGFNYDIAGIGRDDASELNQKQSKSVNASEVMTIGLTDITTTNSTNTAAFGVNSNYLVWGSNNGTMSNSGVNLNIDLGPTTITTITEVVNRKWKVVETGGDVGTARINIPTASFLSGLPALGATDAYVMIVATNAAFTTGLETVFMSTTGANETCLYDFDGTKYISFGVAHRATNPLHITLDGLDDYVRIGNSNELPAAFSVMTWIRPNSTNTLGNERTILSKKSAAGNGYQIVLQNDNKVRFEWYDGSAVLRTAITNTVLPNAKWHNIAFTYAFNTLSIYIDGVLEKTVTMTGNPGTSTGIFSIGGQYITKNAINNLFKGDIDELRMWNRVLTATEIQFIMNQEILQSSTGTIGTIIPSTITKNDINTLPWNNLFAYYSMNSYIGTHLDDDSVNVNRGSLVIPDKISINVQTAPMPYISAANGLWQTAATWTNGANQDVPYSMSIVTPSVPVDWNIVRTTHNVFSEGNKTVLGLFVNTNTLTATTSGGLQTDGTKIEVSHYLKLDGKIDLVGRSQLVQKLGSDLDPTSSGSLERDQQGQANKYNYNYWSSPVGTINNTTNNNSFTVAGVLRDGTNAALATPALINWVAGYDGSPTTPISLARYWIYKFDNLANDYARWTQIGETGPLEASKGFTLKGSGTATADQNLTFLGKPNNGTITNTVGANQLLLIGNPYPSALDADKFINDNINVIANTTSTPTIDGTLYFWEHYTTNNSHNLAAYQGGYGIRNLSGGVAPSATGVDLISGSGTSSKSFPKRYIPVGQGFFVIGKDNTGGTVTFNNSQREFITETDLSSQTTYRIPTTPKTDNHWTDNSNAVVENDTHKKIRLGFNVIDKTFHRQVLLAFMDEKANSEINDGYDAFNIDDSPSDMYLLNGENELAIQGEGYFDEDASFPIAVRTEATGKVSFGIDALENFDQSQNVFIYDKETDTYNSIKNKLYEVELSEGYFKDRFSLRFTDKTLGVKDVIYENSIQVAFTRSNNVLNITNGAIDNTVVAVSLFNIQGKLMSTWDVSEKEQTSIKIPIQNKTSGVYIVKLKTLKGNINKKIIIK
nr:LamG-like jellyroll fold domain-containing protein [uncultured Flavobacterium sp.]